MPSAIISMASGAPFPIISGNFWSGQAREPVGGIQFRADKNNSGAIYLGFSGGMTVQSGGFFLSGAALQSSSGVFQSGGLGYLDGMPLYPGDGYLVPRLAFPNVNSGNGMGVFAACDAGCSGQARCYWEIF